MGLPEEAGKVMTAGAMEGAKMLSREVIKAGMSKDNPRGDDIVKTAADVVAKTVGGGEGGIWNQALGLAQKYMDVAGSPVKQGVLNALTTTAKESGRPSEEGFKGYAKNPGGPRFQSERSVGDPYEVTKGRKWQGWDQRYMKSPDEYRPDWWESVMGSDSPADKMLGAIYENPERVANIAGTAAAAGGAILGGGALNWWSEGSKPRSEYVAPVSPTRGSYNSSVESAQAAAYYKHQLEEQKFNHKMALMDAREQSRVPGTQPVSGSGATPDYGRGDISGMLNQLQNYRPQYF